MDFTGIRKTSGGACAVGQKGLWNIRRGAQVTVLGRGGEGEDAANARKKNRGGALGFLTGGTKDDCGNFRFINDACSLLDTAH